MDDLRIAWLLTSAFFYWHPMLSELTRLFPQTAAFAANWRGYAPGFEDSFKVEVVGQRKIISLTAASTGYGSNFTYLPLGIVNRLLQFKPHVIFSNSFGMWTVLALLLKPLGKWQVVIAYEGSAPSVDYRNSAMRLAMRRAMVRAADACISNSQAGKTYLIEVLQAEKERVFVQPYEVPATESLAGLTASDPEAVELRHPVFLFVGGVIPRKGLDLLVKACVMLSEQNYCDYTLLIVGDGPQRQELEALCQQHHLTECVQWVGRVDYDRVGTYFHKADVFVFPTLEDTWGMVVLEAMVSGKPILCSQWAGAAELVIEGENGYCFDPHSPEKLAELMRRFIDDPGLAASMGHRAEALMAQYSPQAAAQFLAKVASFVSGV